MLLAVRLASAVLCISEVTFLLCFLGALLKDDESLPPRALKVNLAKFNPSRKTRRNYCDEF